MSRGALWFWIIILLAVAAVLGMIVFRFLTAGGGFDPTKIPQPVATAVITTRALDVTYTAQGTIEANNRVDLNAETPGTIARIAFEEGQSVSKGQPLLYLRADKQAAQSAEALAGTQAAQTAVSARAADLQASRANLEASRAAKDLAESEFRRYETLRRQEFVSDLELEQKHAAFVSQMARFRAAQDDVVRAQAQVSETRSQQTQAAARLGYNRALASETVIRAPFSGVIGQKFVDLGDYVMLTEKLVTLVDNRRMKIAFEAPERFLPWLKTGQPVTVSLDEASAGLGNAPALTRMAHVVFVSPTVNPSTHTVTLKALIDGENADDFLRDGQFAKAALTLYTTGDALMVPEQAAVPQGEKFFLYVAQGDRVAFREVVLGERKPGWVQVTSGVRAGEEVVVEGVGKLFDGALIRRQNGARPHQTATPGETSR